MVQSIDLRLSQVEVDSRVRRALTLLHRLRCYYTCDGSRAGFPSALEGAEAILAAHAVADGGDDTVTENNQDAAFVVQWWAVLRPLLPAPQAVTLSGVIALVDSVEEEKAQQHGQDNATGEKGDNTPSRSSTQAWHEAEELKAYQADEARMLEYWDDLDRQEAEAKRRASEARAWDDWALHDSMYPSEARPKRRRVVVRTFEDDIHGSQPTSSHEVHVPSAGVIQILLMPAENPPDLDSEASTAVVGQGTGWPSGVLQAPLAASLPASSPVLPMGHGVDTVLDMSEDGGVRGH